MNTQLIEQTAKKINSVPLLVNLISRRVRQLGMGHRPMVETPPFTGLGDIALTEVMQDKLTYEFEAPEEI